MTRPSKDTNLCQPPAAVWVGETMGGADVLAQDGAVDLLKGPAGRPQAGVASHAGFADTGSRADLSNTRAACPETDEAGSSAINQPAGLLPGMQRMANGATRCALIWCPEIPQGTHFELVRRRDDGAREQLDSGVLDERAPSLNLPRLRKLGAEFGANEVVLILP